MRADFLQAVSIGFYGNAYLAGVFEDRAPELHGYASCFRGVHDVTFERDLEGLLAQMNGVVADGTAGWFKKLRAEGTERFAVVLNEESGPRTGWGIVTEKEHVVELWQPTWKSRLLGGYDDPTPWRVTYVSNRVNRWSVARGYHPDRALANLQRQTDAARAFSRTRGNPALETQFGRCRDLTAAGDATIVGVPDLLPPGMPHESQILTAAALRLMLVLSAGAWMELRQGREDEAHAEVDGAIWRTIAGALEAAVTRSSDVPKEPSTALRSADRDAVAAPEAA